MLVSIHCLTYNHEKYIAEAIESFLMQKTKFEFEILIHDDASTDMTAEIIKTYELKYPDIIKPIYQLENQYSKGISINEMNRFNLDRAQGKYIAVCEGDDYWIDPYKLQKQVDYMEGNPDCCLCVHAGEVVTAAEKKIKSVNRPNMGNKFFSVEEVIEGGGGLFLTSSMLFRKKMGLLIPDCLENAPVGDYSYAIGFALLGKVYYIDEIMSAYRVGHSGSWTATIFNNLEKRKQHFAEIDKMLDKLNEYTSYKYTDVIKRTKMKPQLFILLEQKKFKEIKNGEYKELYQDLYLKLSIIKKLIFFIDQYIPVISNILRRIKRGLIRWIST